MGFKAILANTDLEQDDWATPQKLFDELNEEFHFTLDPYCKLYDEGFERLGCIGCPMAATKNRQRELARYPKYKNAYLMAFEKMIKARDNAGLNTCDMWKTAEGIFHWWIEDGVIAGQTSLFEEEEQQ